MSTQITEERWREYGEVLQALNNSQAVAILATARMVLAGKEPVEGFADAVNRWVESMAGDENVIIRNYLKAQLKTVPES